jgi:hypothetical protein
LYILTPKKDLIPCYNDPKNDIVKQDRVLVIRIILSPSLFPCQTGNYHVRQRNGDM